MAEATILVVEDDDEMLRLLQEELSEAGYHVITATRGAEALSRFRAAEVDAVVTDLVMPGIQGNQLLTEIHGLERDVPVIIMTAFGSIDSAVDAMKSGAYHYLAKPFRIEQLLSTLEVALSERRLKRELQERSVPGATRSSIVAESAVMRKALNLVSLAAASATPVLIVGESGTGKELLARALHSESPRHDGPFVAVNCSAIPEGLLESHLFGHRRGAFTDAREDRRGLFQEADGGTIFLDEIGDMPLVLQAKILRVLEQKEVHPLGAPAPVPVDARVAAATHRDLAALCEEGRFRQDLYYRLNVISIEVPPLRERPQDLVPLTAHFLEKHASHAGRPGCTVGLEAMDLLRKHHWPGNVRELENVILRALVLGSGPVIRPDDLPAELGRSPGREVAEQGVRLLVDVEREQIVKALAAVRGNKAAAARLLGLDRKTLYRKLQAYGIREN